VYYCRYTDKIIVDNATPAIKIAPMIFVMTLSFPSLPDTLNGHDDGS